jgi:nitrate reductase delta subunit
MDKPTIPELLAPLFSYPGGDYHARAGECLKATRGESPEAGTPLAEFSASIEGLSTEQLQELYTRTFDLNPMCTLEIGWQLYGEDYHRGEFLVKMRQQLRKHELHESGELPDHMTHALVLLAKLRPEEAAEFAGEYLLPSLDKMRAGWRENRNPFAALLESAFIFLKSRYPYEPAHTVFRGPELHVLQ